MNTEYARTVCNYNALLRFQILHSQNQRLDEIRITIPVAKEMLRDIEILKKSIDSHNAISRREPAYFGRLDFMFEEQATAINKAYASIIK